MSISVKRRYGGRGLISVEECYAAELRSIDFYLVNSEEELLKVVARLEKIEKDKTDAKKRLQQQNRTRKNGPFKKYETAWSVWKGYRQ